jgi:hypothetical protein
MIAFIYGTKSVTLRNPEFGNAEGRNIKTRFWTAMDSTLFSYRSTSAIKKFSLQIDEISRNKIIEFRDFIWYVNGNKVRYIDPDGNSYYGYIKNNPIDLVNTGRGLGTNEPNREGHQITIEFEVTDA